MSGCGERPVPSVQEVYGYLRNATNGADVARLDDATQEYVNSVLSAYHAWKKATAPVSTLVTVSTLPGLDSDDWRTGAAMLKLAPCVAWLTDRSRASNAVESGEAKTMTRLEQRLDEAIRKVPSSVPGVSPEYVRELLKVDERRRECDELVAACYQVMKLVTQHADQFKPGTTGLEFNDSSVTTEVRAAWQNLHDLLRRRDERHEADLRRFLEEGHEKRAKALDEKKQIKSASSRSDDQYQRLRDLDLLIRYYDQRLNAVQKELRMIERKASQ